MTGRVHAREEAGRPDYGRRRENESTPLRRGRPPLASARSRAIAAAGLVVLASVVGVLAGVGALSRAPSAPSDHSAGATDLAAAQASIQRGQAPASVVRATGGGTAPSSRWALMMTWDAADGYVLAFGGIASNGNKLAQTWSFVGGTWTQLSPTTHPSAREGGMMTYDAADGYVLLFGGYHSGSKALDDTWTFVGGQWTKLSPSVHPPVTEWAGIAYDPVHQYVVMFGGDKIIDTPKYDTTWIYHAGVWMRPTLELPKSPIARNYAAMAYDPANQLVILFGGLGTGGGYLGDTWGFNATGPTSGEWFNLTAASQGVDPSFRAFMSMTYDPSVGGLILYGGESTSGFDSDTWEYVGDAWSLLTPLKNPGALDYYGLAYDPTDGYLVLFGGQHPGDQISAQTWTFSGGTWTKL